MKKLFSIMSVTLMLMIAAVNTANSQTYSIIDNSSGYNYAVLHSYGTGQVRFDITCLPNDPSNTYHWSIQGYNGTPC